MLYQQSQCEYSSIIDIGRHWISIVAADALVLKHQDISSPNAG